MPNTKELKFDEEARHALKDGVDILADQHVEVFVVHVFGSQLGHQAGAFFPLRVDVADGDDLNVRLLLAARMNPAEMSASAPPHADEPDVDAVVRANHSVGRSRRSGPRDGKTRRGCA